MFFLICEHQTDFQLLIVYFYKFYSLNSPIKLWCIKFYSGFVFNKQTGLVYYYGIECVMLSYNSLKYNVNKLMKLWCESYYLAIYSKAIGIQFVKILKSAERETTADWPYESA